PASAASALPSELARSVRSFHRDGFGRLVFSSEEADSITKLAPRSSTLKATGFAANRQLAASGELGRYRIVHFATHGLINSEHPELSGLVLSLVDENGRPQDGFLRMHELFNLQLPADLVVLSACQTALGKEIKGEGLVGLTRGFMHAGAERVVASLWQVDDQATAQLMQSFYRGMLKENLRPAAALRAAQIEMSRNSRWSSPYYWAGFVIQGEWK
ncbi:MAG: CHAT domain-containing protein, partial [Blastocatellia bacterium]